MAATRTAKIMRRRQALGCHTCTLPVMFLTSPHGAQLGRIRAVLGSCGAVLRAPCGFPGLLWAPHEPSW
eukprot:8369157-Pyramimonas_sp.AAC.1